MRVLDQAEYDGFKAKNSDPYGAGVYRFLERWANRMEERIPEGSTSAEVTRIIVDHANADCSEADDEGITGFMYGCAVSVLAKCWIHGEQLRRWHNKDVQIGTEGERANESGGVLNPAILSIG